MATYMSTRAPLRDALFDHLGTVIVDEWPDRAECVACAASLAGECDDHMEQRIRVDALQRLQRDIAAAKDDSELPDILARHKGEIPGQVAA